MTHTEVLVDSHAYRLGNRVGKGGEGAVYAIGNDGKYAVKIYSTTDLASKEKKIAAMVRARLSGHAPLVAFPIAIARSKSGAFVGFVMKLVSDHKPLHELYSPGSRRHHFPQADYRFLVRAASNFARAVASVHQAQCVIGDINHSGALVSPKATVSLIDADSFQFSESGYRYLCRVGVPEYTPPELQGKSLAEIARTANHDSFGLAVVVFQLLFMGRHPFVGTVRHGDIPPLHENIQNFRYAYAENRDVGMDQPPGTPALLDFSPSIASLFDKAFSRESADQRPTAEQWVKHLAALEESLEQCQDNPLHFVPRDASECAWCEMERQLGTVLFLPYIPRPDLSSEGFDPGAGGFNLDLIWARADKVIRSLPKPPLPSLIVGQANPSAKAQEALRSRSGNKPAGYGMVITAAIAIFLAPKLWFIWAGLAYWGYSIASDSGTINSTPFRDAYIEAERRWSKVLDDWERRLGYNDYSALAQELTLARDAYKALSTEERNLRAKYQSERREKHLIAYLDQFDISHQSIHGVGPAKQATLASFGIDTAADITRSRLLAVPGFGEINSRGLLEWRAKLEKRFVYHSQENATDRQEMARISAMIEAKAASLRRKLSVGPQNLEALAKRVHAASASNDPILIQAHQQREQAKYDLQFLGIPIPNVSVASTSQTQNPTPTRGAPSPTYRPPSGSALPSCPRCGSSMVRRLARRGRNAGNHFWGCSRYPRCKGVRNI